MSKKLFLLTAILGAFILFTPACGDKCDTTKCGNGTCLDGTCECDAGYEKDKDGNCNVETRTKLIGTFGTSEQCTGDPSAFPYDITIQAGTNVQDIKIFNFYDSFTSSAVNATVNGTTITIPSQTPVAGGTLQVSGSGTIDATATPVKFTLAYEVKNTTTNTTASCSNTVFVKK
jgi:hypothetical protein